MYKQLCGFIVFLLFSSQAYSICYTNINPVNLSANMISTISDSSYLQFSSQAVQATSTSPILGCMGSNQSSFMMGANTDLNTSSTIIKDGYTYYQIPSNYISPTPNFNVYMAYSVKDNQNNANEYWVNNATTSYSLYNGESDTRGIRLQNLRLLVSGLNNSQGTYTINNLRLGLLSVSGFYQNAQTTIKLSNTTFKVTKTTCLINAGMPINVRLPTVRTSDFTTIGQTLGDTSFSVNIGGCDSSDTNKTLVALFTDNNNSTTSNNNGLLKNTGAGYSTNVSVQITDSNGSPTPIAPKTLNSSNSFLNFGTIGATGTVSKSFKARYYSNAIPVPATNVYAQATITLIYN